MTRCNPHAAATSQIAFEWLEHHCPEDLVAKVMCFAGPQETLGSLSQSSNGLWRKFGRSEETWRVCCEELGKWHPSEPEPQSWRDHYQRNPRVPADFPSIQEALKSAVGTTSSSSITSPAPSSGEESTIHIAKSLPQYMQSTKGNDIRILLRPGSYTVEETLIVNTLRECDRVTIETIGSQHTTSSTKIPAFIASSSSSRATLIMKTPKRNAPIIHVMRGALCLKNITLDHSCHGTDFLNGNAAIHIQPFEANALPSASLEHVEITSHSGQGIVNYHGGNIRVQNCYIHDCAATGLFVYARHCDVLVQRTDIMANGHAGMHLEFGTATVLDCGIVGNSSIGVSVYGSNLSLELSDVVANGYQLETELPPKTLRHNNIATLLEQSAAHSGFRTRTSMAQRNVVHHMSKVTALMKNRQRFFESVHFTTLV